MDNLTKFIDSINKEKKVKPFFGKVLAFDPGETTGYAVFTSRLVPSSTITYLVGKERAIDYNEINQVKTWPLNEALPSFTSLIKHHRPDIVVNESYHIYKWKLETHTWSPVNTIQIIGMIKTLCLQHDIPNLEISAQNAKSFWTDEQLKAFNIYFAGKHHGRDAQRHALHFLCFGGTPI